MSASALEVVAIDTPPSVSHARRWLREELDGRAAPEVRERAELVLSELVTNAVLHSPGPVRVSVSRREGCLAIEVVDANPHARPTVPRYSADAATGRGLRIVDACAAAWGVRDLAAGKGVWALVTDPERPDSAERCVERFSPDHWLLEDPTAHHVAPGARPTAPPPVAVALRGLPLWAFFTAREHDDALLRELRLLAASGDADGVPAHLLELATATRRQLAAQGTQLREQVAAAVARDAATLDIELTVPRAGWTLVARLGELLDEADAYCEQGELLTLAAPRIVRQVRAWSLGEIRAQLEGAEPRPWPGPVEPPAPGRTEVDDPKERR